MMTRSGISFPGTAFAGLWSRVMSTFEFANQALRRDLAAYASALSTIVHALPRARDLCDRIVKETRLVQALLAFATGQHAADLTQSAYRLRNLWPYRERPFARTLGFSDEIAEAIALREEAQRSLKLISRQNGDPLLIEITTCISNIQGYLEEQQKLLEACHSHIQPHAQNMDLTRRRLDLLIAAIDARVPDSDSQHATLRAYQATADLLRDWESGVPIDKQGVDILQRCIECLEQADVLILNLLNPIHPARVTQQR
jgi:hypothetical protein